MGEFVLGSCARASLGSDTNTGSTAVESRWGALLEPYFRVSLLLPARSGAVSRDVHRIILVGRSCVRVHTSLRLCRSVSKRF